MGIARYIGSRLIVSIPLVMLAFCINFTIIHMAPGSPVDFILSSGELHLITPLQLEAIKKEYGLDKSIPEQLVIYLSKAFQGDLGYSADYHRPVMSLIQEKLGWSFLLLLPSLALSLLLGIITGVKSSEKVYSLSDNLNTIFALIFWAMPGFWFGMIMIQIFAVILHWLPAQSIVDIEVTGITRIISYISHLILPTIVISIGGYAGYTRYTRSSMLEVLRKDFILTARAKGCTDRQVYYKHAFRNAALPLVTLVALRMPGIFMGSVLIETVFSYPGMGMLLFRAIARRDYNIILGIFLIYTVLTVLFNLIADIAYSYLDPRIRYKG